MKGKKVLLIDDEQSIHEVISTIFEDMGHEVTGHTDALRGERAALADTYDLILLDLRMPRRNGAEIAKSVLKNRAFFDHCIERE